MLLPARATSSVSVARSPRPTKMPSLANVQGELVLLSLASDGNVLLPVPAIVRQPSVRLPCSSID
jgi:hypothetical protein